MMYDERRKHPRAPIARRAAVSRSGQALGSFRVINLSGGGALLEGSCPIAVGDPLQVAIQLSGDSSVEGGAVVVRMGRTRKGATFALAFTSLSQAAEDAVVGAVRSALDEARTASVLIVELQGDLCQYLRQSLGDLGASSFAVDSVADAMSCLGEENRFTAAFIDLDLGQGGKKLLSHLEAHHPRIRRVLVSTPAPPNNAPVAVPLTSGAQQHSVLITPWTAATLRLALGAS